MKSFVTQNLITCMLLWFVLLICVFLFEHNLGVNKSLNTYYKHKSAQQYFRMHFNQQTSELSGFSKTTDSKRRDTEINCEKREDNSSREEKRVTRFQDDIFLFSS